MEIIKKLLRGDYNKSNSGEVPEGFLQDYGFHLVNLYKISDSYPNFFKDRFTIKEYEQFLWWLKSEDEWDARHFYENMVDKLFFYEEDTLNPAKLLLEGYVPELEFFDRPHKQVFLAAMLKKRPCNWAFFHGGVSPEEFLRKRRVWIKAEDVVGKHRSLALMFTRLELFYSSKHEKTDMLMFQQAHYQTGKTRNGILYVNDKQYRIYGQSSKDQHDGVAFPVSRYAENIDIGLYHRTSSKGYCGTFYYVEPESNTFLVTNNVIYSRTKTTAAMMLAVPGTEFFDWASETMESDKKNEYFVKYIEGDIRPGFLYTPIQAYKELGFVGYSDPYKVSQEPFYMGATSMKEYDPTLEGLYAIEDPYDQPLCIEMKRQNIEVACFTEMIGAFGLVKELLDTRSRKESFLSLVYTH